MQSFLSEGARKMNRRKFVLIALMGAAMLSGLNGGQVMAAAGGNAGSDKKGALVIQDASISDLQTAMESGKTTSVALVKAYLERIKKIDKSGPTINSIIELNPDALAIAAALDIERKNTGSRSPMHGIPILIKDNIATADKMETTAGSLAMVGVKPQRDAFIVEKLRAAGAVILGKTNLSEWANFRSTRSSSGWRYD
jgi:amidase